MARRRDTGRPQLLTRLGVTLRPERPVDEPFVRRLYHGSRADEVAAANWPASMAARFLDDQFRLQSAHFAARHPAADLSIIEALPTRGGVPVPIGPVPIGRLYVDRSEPAWRLLEIGLLAAWQGRGIGAALIRHLQHDAEAGGAGSLALSVLHSNPRAAALYARLGFDEAASLVPTHRTMVWRA